MKILFIIFCVILFLLLLMFLPVTADISYQKEFCYRFKYSGIVLFNSEKKFNIDKFKRKRKKKVLKDNLTENDSDTNHKKENFFVKIYKEKGFINTVKYFADISGIILKRVLKLLKRFKFKKFKLNLTVASDDAANTAIEYGAVCSAVYPVIALLETQISLKSKKVSINADFDKTKPEFDFSVSITAKLINFIIAFIAVIFEFLKLQRKERENQ